VLHKEGSLVVDALRSVRAQVLCVRVLSLQVTVQIIKLYMNVRSNLLSRWWFQAAAEAAALASAAAEREAQLQVLQLVPVLQLITVVIILKVIG
jgi:hypothetical protein